MNDNQPNLESLSRTQILVLMGVTAIILLLITQVWQRWGNIALVPFHADGESLLKGVLLGALVIALSALVNKFWLGYRLSAKKYLNLIVTPLNFPDLIWVGLLPGLSEELLFRGLMIPAFGYGWIAVILSSILFGVLHWNDQADWHYVLWATIIGFMFGCSVYFTDNLCIPMTAHIVTNFISSLLWKINPDYE